MIFPHKCCRCGFCCLSKVCIIGQEKYNVEEYDICPGLSFQEEGATCDLAGIVPVGDGCCIKARAYKDGKEYDFAALPEKLKKAATVNILLSLKKTIENEKFKGGQKMGKNKEEEK